MFPLEGRHLKGKIASKFNKFFRRQPRPCKPESATYFEVSGSSKRPANSGVGHYDIPPPGIRPVYPPVADTKQQLDREWFKQDTAPQIWDTEQTIDLIIDGLLDPHDEQEKFTSTVLTGEFDPKNYLHQIPNVDTTGNELPPWKKMLIAKQMAEKEYQKAMEKKQKEQEELKYKDMPVWKKVIMQKRDNERNLTSGQESENQLKKN